MKCADPNTLTGSTFPTLQAAIGQGVLQKFAQTIAKLWGPRENCGQSIETVVYMCVFPEPGQTVTLGDERVPRKSYSPENTKGLFSVKLLI